MVLTKLLRSHHGARGLGGAWSQPPARRPLWTETSLGSDCGSPSSCPVRFWGQVTVLPQLHNFTWHHAAALSSLRTSQRAGLTCPLAAPPVKLQPPPPAHTLCPSMHVCVWACTHMGCFPHPQCPRAHLCSLPVKIKLILQDPTLPWPPKLPLPGTPSSVHHSCRECIHACISPTDGAPSTLTRFPSGPQPCGQRPSRQGVMDAELYRVVGIFSYVLPTQATHW